MKSLATRLVYASKNDFGLLPYSFLKLIGVEFPRSVQVSSGLSLAHGAVGLVVHERVTLGANVTLHQGVTLGRADTHLFDSCEDGAGITIEDNVTLGANSVVLFKHDSLVTLKEGTVLGANSTLLRSTDPWCIYAGNPARKIRSLKFSEQAVSPDDESRSVN